MSSRLAKSTSKFRPVKPQPKKQGSTPTVSAPAAPASQVTAAPSGSSAPAPAPSSSSAAAAAAPNDSSSIPADVFSAVAAAANNAQAPPSEVPTSSTVSITPAPAEPLPEEPSQNENEPPATSIQPSLSEPQPLEVSSQPPPPKRRVPGVIARLSPRKTAAVATPELPSSTQEAPPASQDDAPSTSQLAPPPASSSRQGTPISFGGSTFGVGSWRASEPTQTSTAPPASSAQSSSGIPDSQATLVDSASQKEPSSKEAEPAIAIEKAPTASQVPAAGASTSQSISTSPAEPGTSSVAPRASPDPHALPPLPTPLPASSSTIQLLPPLPPGHSPVDEDEIDTLGDQDAEGEDEGDIPVPEEGTAEVATTKKKRGRPPGKGRAAGATAAAAKGKKAAAKPRAKGKKRQEANAPEDEEEGIEAVEDGEDDEEDAALTQGTVKKRPAKRKAPAKSKKKAKKKKRTPAEGEASDEEDEQEYDEEGNLIYEPWEISKAHPGYSLNTRDIFAAVGVELPESFDFRTAQDIADAIDEDENEEEGDREPVEGEEDQERDGEQDQPEDEYREDDEEDGEEGTTPWAPFKGKAVDPAITTMKQLTEDTGRGRITPKLITSMTSKISAKQKVKVARERMKLRVALKKAGLDPEAIERRLDQEMETIMHGGILEFTEDDRSAPIAGHLIGTGHAQTEEASVREGDQDGSRQGTPYDGHGNGQQALFRPEENSDEEDARNRQYDEDGNEIYPEEEEEEEGYAGMIESQYAPQMRFVDGQFVLDESSTQIVRGTEARDAFAVMEDTHDSRKINSASWGKRGKASRWTMADTDLFYEGLTQFGTDFELISRMFSNRTRRQIKAKFVREEKIDSDRLEEALSGKKKIDINFYERMTKLDFRNGVVPADPMAKFYDGLPTAESAVKLESNRDASPGQELDLAALLRKKKEDTAGLGGWENSRAPREFDGDGQEAIPEEEMEGEEGQQYEEEHEGGDHVEHDEQMHEQYEDQGEVAYRSPTPEQEEEPFSFSGGIQLRVSG